MGTVALVVGTLVTVTVTVIFGAHLPEPNFPRFTPKADINVTCILRHNCTLPCPFQGEFTEASWSREDSFIPIIVEPPGQWTKHIDYRNIASMPGGGAALEIRGVQLKHQGLHRCSVTPRTGETINQFIDLNVHAPVVDVSLELRGEELLCRSEGIYPEPAVTWTSSSGPDPDPQTSINPSETGLFSVLSSVPLTLSESHIYSCNVSTEHSWRSATYRRNPHIHLSDSLTVPCNETTAPVKSLVWKFNQKIIYKRTGTDQSFSGFWSDFVDGLTESNGLTLKNLTLDQLGLFTCEVSTETESFIIATEVTDRKSETTELWSVADGVLLPVGISLTILFLCLTILLLRCRRRLYLFCVRPRRRRPNIEEDGRGEEAAAGLNPVDEMELEENPRQSENFKLNTDHRESQESFYESQSTDTPRGSVWSESSGLGQSGPDTVQTTPKSLRSQRRLPEFT